MAKLNDPSRLTLAAPTDALAYRVRLRDNRQLVILDDSPHRAVEKYKYACGIITTDNQFDVEPVTDEAELANARDLPLRDGPPLVGFTPTAEPRKDNWLHTYGV